MSNSSIKAAFERLWYHIMLKLSEYTTRLSFEEHISNKTNPHEVILSQLGVTVNAEEINQLSGVNSNIQEQISTSVNFAKEQFLTEEQKAQARTNIGVSEGGLPDTGFPEAAEVPLLALFRKAVFKEDVSDLIQELANALGRIYYTISLNLEHTTAQLESEIVEAGGDCTVVLTAEYGYVLDTVTVTMGGQDITDSVWINEAVVIPSVMGDVVITAVAQKISNPIQYVVGSIQNSVGVLTYKSQNVASTTRFCCVTKEVTGDVPFVTTDNDGDLYLVPVPETATKVKVICPGYRIEIKLIILEEGVYKIQYDASWVGNDDVTFNFTQGKYGYIVINYKKTDNSSFNFNTVDISSLSLEFE